MKKNKTNLHVASWNILIDDTGPYTPTLPQHQRCDSLSDSLRLLNFDLDFLGLYEVEGDSAGNCGEHIAADLGMKNSEWAQHGRPQEGIVLASRKPMAKVRHIILNPDEGNRVALIGEQGPVAIAVTHLTSYLPLQSPGQNLFLAYMSKHSWRMNEISKLLDELSGYDKAIIMGDFNCLPSQKPRKLLESAGFVSAVARFPKKSRGTFPTTSYNRVSVKPWQGKLIPKGLSIDDIYVRNLKLIDGGPFEGNTDHHGLWAKLEI
jgi:endonuclease/exonuclease/phosphatase family metal-dependent hydrolase